MVCINSIHSSVMISQSLSALNTADRSFTVVLSPYVCPVPTYQLSGHKATPAGNVMEPCGGVNTTLGYTRCPAARMPDNTPLQPAYALWNTEEIKICSQGHLLRNTIWNSENVKNIPPKFIYVGLDRCLKVASSYLFINISSCYINISNRWIILCEPGRYEMKIQSELWQFFKVSNYGIKKWAFTNHHQFYK